MKIPLKLKISWLLNNNFRRIKCLLGMHEYKLFTDCIDKKYCCRCGLIKIIWEK